MQELLINCELAEVGREMGCQTMVEGPGHIPINEIEAVITLQKKMSGDAPFYMLGPITTDRPIVIPIHAPILPIACARTSGRVTSAIKARITEENAALPCSIRARTRTQALRANAPITLPAAKRTSPKVIVRFRPIKSLKKPNGT